DVLPREPHVVRTDRLAAAHAHGKSALRREQHLVALALDPLAGEHLARTITVDIGGVDEVDAGLDRAIEHALRVVVARRDALHERLRFTERHRAERDGADLEPTGAEPA